MGTLYRATEQDEGAKRKARGLLSALRRTAMRRGAISAKQRRHESELATAIEGQGVLRDLARRVAFQLVFKFTDIELADRAVWRALGQLLHREAKRLRSHVGLAERQIATVLPKLSAGQVEEFFQELQRTDRRIARTILNASLQAADPLSMGRRYLQEYHGVAEHLHAIDPKVARTLANASFTACAPRRKAMEHLKEFKAAEDFIGDVNAVIAELVSSGVEVPPVRTLAGAVRVRRYFQAPAKAMAR